MNIKKVLLAVPMSLSLLAPMSAFAQQPDTSVITIQQDKLKADQEKLAKSKAMNPQEEQKKLKELGLDGKAIKLNKDKPLVLNFDDGSRIEYSYSVDATPAERLPVLEKSLTTQSLVTPSSMVYKTASVRKQYFYGTANANTGLYTDYKQDGFYMWVRSNFPFFQGTFCKSDYQNTRTIDGDGNQYDMMTTELNGQFTTTAPYAGDYYTRTYLYRMDIDHWGGAYLRVIF